VLFILTHAPNLMLAAGQGTAADAMLGYAGARNALPSLRGYQALTPEAIVAAQPDVIVLSRQGLRIQGGIDALLKNTGLGLTPAGNKRRVIALDEMSLLGFGPSMPAAVAELDNALRAATAI
jgi:iron complex transport system substrate-binding protein